MNKKAPGRLVPMSSKEGQGLRSFAMAVAGSLIKRTVGLIILVLFIVATVRLMTTVPDIPMTSKFTDEQLFAQVAALEGVDSADIAYRNEFGNDNIYVGTIIVSQRDQALRLLDHTVAILRQGRRNASIIIVVNVKSATGEAFGMYDLLGSDVHSNLDKRYGPQPGNGMPPADLPVLRK